MGGVYTLVGMGVVYTLVGMGGYTGYTPPGYMQGTTTWVYIPYYTTLGTPLIPPSWLPVLY